MTNLKMLRDLFHHMEWADALVWQAVFAQPRTFTDSVVRDRLFHIHLVQRGFLLVWRTPSAQFPEAPAFSDGQALASWAREYYRGLASYLDAIDEASLDQSVSLPWADQVTEPLGQSAAPTTLAQTMLQVTSHSTHHRGQVNTRLRELGGEPPLIDFIVWAWLGKPAAEWPAHQLDEAAPDV